jgi:hypothetical protein
MLAGSAQQLICMCLTYRINLQFKFGFLFFIIRMFICSNEFIFPRVIQAQTENPAQNTLKVECISSEAMHFIIKYLYSGKKEELGNQDLRVFLEILHGSTIVRLS